MSLLCLALMALSGAEALLSLHARSEPAVVNLPIQRRRGINSGHIQKRAATISLPFDIQDNDEPLFFCKISLGTPPQNTTAYLDTRSSYLSVSAYNSSLCAEITSSNSDECLLGAPFDVSNSSTYTSIGTQINTTDGIDETFTGILSTDMLTIGSTTLDTDLIVDYTPIADNILGLGYSLNGTYTSLPQALVNSGQINSAAYSLWADDLGDTGSLLFGGVNSAKYTGELHTMSIPAAADGIYYQPTVLVTDIYVQGNSSTSSANTNTSGLPAYMILDSYTPWTYLPDAVVERIYQDLNVSFGWVNTAVGEIADCSVENQNYSIIFTFADFDINIPLSFFLYEENNSCEFTIVPSGGEAGFLGSNFLRAVYTVFDLSNNEISLAQRNFNNSVPDNILEIGNGSTTAIPGAVSVSASITATIDVPTTATEPPLTQTFVFPPASSTSTEASSSASTTTAKNAAPTFTSRASNLAAGLIGAWFWIAL